MKFYNKEAEKELEESFKITTVNIVTDSDLTRWFIHLYLGIIFFIPKSKEFYCWNGSIFEPDVRRGKVHELLKKLIEFYLYIRSGLVENNYNNGISLEKPKDIITARQKLLKDTTLSRISTAISRIVDIHKEISNFDSSPYLLNCLNGIVDLRKMILLKHSPEYQMTKITTVEYSRWQDHFKLQYICPVTYKFLKNLFGSGINMKLSQEEIEDRINSFLAYIAYSITGETSERIFGLFRGLTASGKTILVRLFTEFMLGSYSMITQPNTFFQNGKNEAGQDLPRLRASRIVFASESKQGDVLNSTMIKQFTGADKIIVRRKYKDPEEITSIAKVFMFTNVFPEIKDLDGAMARRIVTFDTYFSVAKGSEDENLLQKLAPETSKFLSYLIFLSQKYYASREIPVANSFLISKRRYLLRNIDSTKIFLNLFVRPGAVWIFSKDLFENYYKPFCLNNALEPLTDTSFGTVLRSAGFIKENNLKSRQNSSRTYFLDPSLLQQTFRPLTDEDFENALIDYNVYN